MDYLCIMNTVIRDTHCFEKHKIFASPILYYNIIIYNIII